MCQARVHIRITSRRSPVTALHGCVIACLVSMALAPSAATRAIEFSFYDTHLDDTSVSSLVGVASLWSPGLHDWTPFRPPPDAKVNRELYVGNLPPGINAPQLIQFLNQVCSA